MRKPVVGHENAGPCVAEATTLDEVEELLVLLLLELEELLVEGVVRDEDVVELELELELEVELEEDMEVLLAREEEDELDEVDDEVEPDVLVVVADVDVLLELEPVDASVFA